MRGPKPKYKIQLLENEISELRQLIKARSSLQGKVMRAWIILAAHEYPEWSNQQIASHFGCTDRSVMKWRRRWNECKSVDDLPKPGRPKRFSPEVRAQATALACSVPMEQGVMLSRWSLAEIVKHLLCLQAESAISVSTLYRWFTADKLKPWRYHHWQHILDPHRFLERARPVLQVCEHAVELLRSGVWAVCVDEKTSIQARQREQESVAAKPQQPVHLAARYKR